jgi:hypothetical protein
MGPHSEKLSANNAEARTEAVKSFSPEWNKEILLQDPRVSMEEVTGVMILVRDAASGVLKHHHIGQVTIPISCFLYQTEADFCLPLEPSYRWEVFSLLFLCSLKLLHLSECARTSSSAPTSGTCI